jgi:hypothetical protein
MRFAGIPRFFLISDSPYIHFDVYLTPEDVIFGHAPNRALAPASAAGGALAPQDAYFTSSSA